MFDIKITGNFPDPDEIVRGIMEERAAEMQRLVCTEHNQRANVKVVRSGGEWGIDGSFCCERLKERAMRVFA
jgi:hypothetical protein